VVGVAQKTTRHTGEGALIRSVSLIHTTAGGTGLRGISRINIDHRHACSPSLVVQEGTQLKERPRMQRGSLGAPKPYPVADSAQVFQSEAAPSALRFCHEAFTQVVVRPFCEAGLAAGQRFEAAFGRVCAFALEFGAQATMAIAHRVDRAGRVDFTIRVDCDVDDAQVNAQDAFDVLWRGFFNFAGRGEKEFVTEQNQVGFALAGLEKFSLMLAAHEWNGHASIHRPDGNRVGSPAQNAVVVSQTPHRLELATHTPGQLVSIGDLGDTAHRHLRREFELLAHRSITQVMEVILPEGLRLPGLLADKLTGGIANSQRLLKGLGLFGGGQEFDLRDQFHTSSIEHPASKSRKESLFEGRRFLHTPEGGGIHAVKI